MQSSTYGAESSKGKQAVSERAEKCLRQRKFPPLTCLPCQACADTNLWVFQTTPDSLVYNYCQHLQEKWGVVFLEGYILQLWLLT